MTDNNHINQIENDIDKLTAEFEEKLKSIDPELIAQIRVGRGLKLPDGHFSDWHDTWNDRDRWSKSWGKAGDKSTFDFDNFEEKFSSK